MRDLIEPIENGKWRVVEHMGGRHTLLRHGEAVTWQVPNVVWALALRIAELEDALRARRIEVNSAALSDARKRIDAWREVAAQIVSQEVKDERTEPT